MIKCEELLYSRIISDTIFSALWLSDYESFQHYS